MVRRLITPNNVAKESKVLKKDAGPFLAEFEKTRPNYLRVSSQDPLVCWTDDGVISFLALSVFSGPVTLQDSSCPLLLRARINLYPPPALTNVLQSRAIQQKLGITKSSPRADVPSLELTVAPGQLPSFSSFVAYWFDSFLQQTEHFIFNSRFPVIHLGMTDTGGNKKIIDPLSQPHTWRQFNYLWTNKAADEWCAWLSSSDKRPGTEAK